MRRVILVLTTVIVSATMAGAANVTFEWGASTGADGYYLHSSLQSGVYNHDHAAAASNWVNTGNPCNAAQVCTFSWNVPDEQSSVFFVVTAYNTVGESLPSNEAFVDPVASLPTAPSNLRILP